MTFQYGIVNHKDLRKNIVKNLEALEHSFY